MGLMSGHGTEFGAVRFPHSGCQRPCRCIVVIFEAREHIPSKASICPSHIWGTESQSELGLAPRTRRQRPLRIRISKQMHLSHASRQVRVQASLSKQIQEASACTFLVKLLFPMSELPAGQAEKPAHDAHPISASSPAEDEDLQYLSTRQLYAVFGALVIILLMFALDVTVIATAIPKVTDEFHTIKDIGWYGGAYLITTAALQPLTGKVFTHLPLKTSYLVFVGVFELGSLLCGAAKSSTMLIVGRSVAGMGAAGLANGSLTILKRAAPPEKQPMLMSLLMSVFGVGQVLGLVKDSGLLTRR